MFMLFYSSMDSKTILNYINSCNSPYCDDLLEASPFKDVFWNTSVLRKASLSFYPIKEKDRVLVVGDNFGAITGVLLEKFEKVTSLVNLEENAKAIIHRYSSYPNVKEKLNVLSTKIEAYKSLNKYPYIFFYFEHFDEAKTTDFLIAREQITQIIQSVKENGKIIILTNKADADFYISVLSANGFIFSQTIEPLKNGEIIIEASKTDNLSILTLPSTSPTEESMWCRKFGIPFLEELSFSSDQDFALIQKVCKVEIDLLSKLVEVCKKHNLLLYPMYGSLLGIIRDGGMILGDDDIDVALPRKDYDTLMGLGDEFTGKYFLQTPYSDCCFFGGYAKLRNTQTTALHPRNWWVDCNEGISIDIFPIDKTFTNIHKEKSKLKKIKQLQRLLYAKSYGYFRNFEDMPLLIWKAYKYAGKLISKDKLVDKLYSVMNEGNESSIQNAIYTHYAHGKLDSARYIKKQYLTKAVSLHFEGIEMQVPLMADSILRSLYGEQYNIQQEFCEEKKRHGFYDTDIPYKVYKKRFSGLKHIANIKNDVICFGNSSIIEDFIKAYKSRLSISKAVLFPEEQVNGETYIDSVLTQSWNTFFSKNNAPFYAIICYPDIRQAEKMLVERGIKDYCIFLANRDWMLSANTSWIWKCI